ncbi:MAG: TolC family protein [Cyclobacteriaceae bacterium]|nr:TolC family protein [Cyclobacteriaceae bacterium]
MQRGAYREYQEADASQEIFQHQIKTANAYLDVVMTYELVKVYSKNLERAQDNVRIVEALTRSGLRPGTDTALFNAELSRAKIDLINHENLRETQQVLLSELLGGGEGTYTIDSSFFKLLPLSCNQTRPSQNHPINQYRREVG